jgi:hypothetical protein
MFLNGILDSICTSGELVYKKLLKLKTGTTGNVKAISPDEFYAAILTLQLIAENRTGQKHNVCLQLALLYPTARQDVSRITIKAFVPVLSRME